MATDANLILQASVTKTSTFNGAWVQLPGGTPRRGLKVRVLYSATDLATSTGTVTWSIDVSPDNGTTVYAAEYQAVDQAVTLSTTAQSGEVWIPIEGPISETATSGQYYRLTMTIGGSPGTPTTTYQGDFCLGRP